MPHYVECVAKHMVTRATQNKADLTTPEKRQTQINKVWAAFYSTYQPAAALVIQAYWRGHRTRRQMKAKKYGLLLRFVRGPKLRDSAARVIQRFVRGFIGRLRAKERQRAIIDIQRCWKGYCVRKSWRRRLRNFRWERDAAIEIQRHARGHLVRSRLRQLEAAKQKLPPRPGAPATVAKQKVPTRSEAREAAVVVLQKYFRGWKARRQVKWLREQQSAKKRWLRDQESAKQRHHAALVIQRRYRAWKQDCTLAKSAKQQAMSSLQQALHTSLELASLLGALPQVSTSPFSEGAKAIERLCEVKCSSSHSSSAAASPPQGTKSSRSDVELGPLSLHHHSPHQPTSPMPTPLMRPMRPCPGGSPPAKPLASPRAGPTLLGGLKTRQTPQAASPPAPPKLPRALPSTLAPRPGRKPVAAAANKKELGPLRAPPPHSKPGSLPMQQQRLKSTQALKPSASRPLVLQRSASDGRVALMNRLRTPELRDAGMSTQSSDSTAGRLPYADPETAITDGATPGPLQRSRSVATSRSTTSLPTRRESISRPGLTSRSFRAQPAPPEGQYAVLSLSGGLPCPPASEAARGSGKPAGAFNVIHAQVMSLTSRGGTL